MNSEDHKRAMEQGKAQFNSIKEMIEELREAQEKAISGDNNSFDAEEEARQTIQEDPLSVQVRGDWYSPGDEQGSKPTEYEILLCTGGPAARIIGELDDYCQPESAKLQYQDWFMPWTDLELDEDDEAILLEYASEFWYGE